MQGASDMPRKKLVCVGDGGCGKTALLTVFATGRFPEVYIPTVFETTSADVVVDNRPLQFSLWDTAGQEEYERLRPLSYPDTDVVIVCFDVTFRDSLENIAEKWFPELEQHIAGVPIIVVGCKADAREDPQMKANLQSKGQTAVTYQEGAAMATRIGARGYVECSAKFNQNVRDVFEYAGRVALARNQPAATHQQAPASGGGPCGDCTIL
ncbi:GTP-binding protein Rho1 [Irineochytrium annulatum]|nr:GTP-binding protein Rho1 [Irineochytrium annulatum]